MREISATTMQDRYVGKLFNIKFVLAKVRTEGVLPGRREDRILNLDLSQVRLDPRHVNHYEKYLKKIRPEEKMLI